VARNMRVLKRNGIKDCFKLSWCVIVMYYVWKRETTWKQTKL